MRDLCEHARKWTEGHDSVELPYSLALDMASDARAFQHGLVSVVMPCLNAAPFVEQAVRSVFTQEYANVQLIAVDDGSSDGSREILDRLARQHPSQMMVLATACRGPYPARNTALGKARGEFVAFLDADDYWDPACLRELHTKLMLSSADAAYCGWQNFGEGAPGTEPYVPPAYEDADPVQAFLRTCPWPIHAALVKRDIVQRLGGFSERRFSSMDYDFWLRLLTVTRRIVRVPKVFAYYRWHGAGQISSVRWRQVLDAWQVRRDFVQANPALVAHLTPPELRKLVDGVLIESARRAYWKRDLDSAQRLFRKAMGTRCWRLADLRYLLPSFLPRSAYRALIAAADRR